ncbi:site-specific integrase [Phenylobacterium sp.]|uniref:site-specific integrase n=1 Tax=Phenylobacterium sp. TaxID=1871053 RepID=UPI0027282F39|nr:site-specific integrase [Phenylobacterium sp.]MDO8799420.1 site-specific integrase [Phenylobacterium sp.]
MSKPSRRQGSAFYYARRAIPKDLREAYGKREIWKSLDTTDFEAAKPIERRKQLEWDEEFAAIRRELEAAVQPAEPGAKWRAMTPAQRAAWQRQRDEYEQDEREYQRANPVPDYDDLSPEEQRTQDAVEAARERWEKNQSEEREALRQERLAEAGTKQSNVVSAKAQGTSLAVVFGKWAQNQKNQKTIDRMEKVVEWFEDEMGRVPIEEITPDHVLNWSEKLQKRTTAANARTKLANFNTLLRYAWMKARLIPANPALGVSIGVSPDPEEDVQPFDLPALKLIFGSPVYTSDERPEAGVGEAAYWLPLLAMFTGARLNELGQLRPSDILKLPYMDKDGNELEAWCIRIVADKAEGLKLKNRWSARRVPIHSDLIRLGFLTYVETAREAGQARIFPELRPDKYAHITANWSKWFGRYLRGTIKVTNRRMRFHSFRHAFKDYAREAEIPEDVNDAFTGHKGQAVARRYGSSLAYPLRPMVSAMAQYRVTGLTLPLPPPANRDQAPA